VVAGSVQPGVQLIYNEGEYQGGAGEIRLKRCRCSMRILRLRGRGSWLDGERWRIHAGRGEYWQLLEGAVLAEITGSGLELPMDRPGQRWSRHSQPRHVM